MRKNLEFIIESIDKAYYKIFKSALDGKVDNELFDGIGVYYLLFKETYDLDTNFSNPFPICDLSDDIRRDSYRKIILELSRNHIHFIDLYNKNLIEEMRKFANTLFGDLILYLNHLNIDIYEVEKHYKSILTSIYVDKTDYEKDEILKLNAHYILLPLGDKPRTIFNTNINKNYNYHEFIS
ncbi:hypothetical protein [Photobacterium leiognathi]|uniref:hypothetical protein n=1 Tax=Photobacterium leiognathi TaxID=553611 RepID=UPI002982A0A4|nr:hypothetical protein [Photobacterium leiognathi]